MLDFLRYSHIDKIISVNQILCYVFVILGLYCIYKNNKVKKSNTKFQKSAINGIFLDNSTYSLVISTLNLFKILKYYDKLLI